MSIGQANLTWPGNNVRGRHKVLPGLPSTQAGGIKLVFSIVPLTQCIVNISILRQLTACSKRSDKHVVEMTLYTLGHSSMSMGYEPIASGVTVVRRCRTKFSAACHAGSAQPKEGKELSWHSGKNAHGVNLRVPDTSSSPVATKPLSSSELTSLSSSSLSGSSSASPSTNCYSLL